MAAPPIAWHVTLRLEQDFDRVIATSTPALRRTAGAFLRLGTGAEMLAFGVADTHMHALLACERLRAGRFVHDLEVSLGRVLALGVPFAPARLVAVENQAHLSRAFDYVLRQDDRHDLGRDPFREGTNLPDLVGARIQGAWTRAVLRRLLPREDSASLAARLPFGEALRRPAPAEAIHLLGEAVAAVALAGSPASCERSAVRARRAAVHLAGALVRPGDLGALVRPGDLARHVGVSPGALRRLREGPVEPPLVDALRLQIRMRHAAFLVDGTSAATAGGPAL